jgi:hypothetical protein
MMSMMDPRNTTRRMLQVTWMRMGDHYLRSRRHRGDEAAWSMGVCTSEYSGERAEERSKDSTSLNKVLTSGSPIRLTLAAAEDAASWWLPAVGKWFGAGKSPSNAGLNPYRFHCIPSSINAT